MRDVLVVEDDRAVLRAVARLCRSEGLQVDEATSVEQAEARLCESGYRLALVDLMLPERSGFELLNPELSTRPPISTVMISGYATIDSALQSFRLGAFDFLPKPFDVAELLGVVRRALRDGERRSQELPEQEETADRRYFLGRHSWAAPEAGGAVTLGAAESFHGLLGDLGGAALPGIGEQLSQCRRLARLESAEEAHRIWSPLSGRVVAVNTELEGAVNRLDRSPFDLGWLVRIVPAELPGELTQLTFRSVQAVTAEGG
jgi:CheY-like chemotaxis protein/glycine cleavage system H lipoate-binding protein